MKVRWWCWVTQADGPENPPVLTVYPSEAVANLYDPRRLPDTYAAKLIPLDIDTTSLERVKP